MRIAICPNVSSVQIPPPHLNNDIDEWQLYSHNIDATAAYELRSSHLVFSIEAGVIRPGLSDGVSLGKQIIHLMNGHHPHLINLDRPLTYGCAPYSPYGYARNHCNLDKSVVFSLTGIFVDICYTHEVSATLIESWPHNAAESIGRFVDYLQRRSKGIYRLVFDWDPNAGASQVELYRAIRFLGDFCKANSVEFAPIVTCHSPLPGGTVLSADEFISRALGHWRRLRQCGSYDRVIVQSWARTPNGKRDIPPTSALITLAEEILNCG